MSDQHVSSTSLITSSKGNTNLKIDLIKLVKGADTFEENMTFSLHEIAAYVLHSCFVESGLFPNYYEVPPCINSHFNYPFIPIMSHKTCEPIAKIPPECKSKSGLIIEYYGIDEDDYSKTELVKLVIVYQNENLDVCASLGRRMIKYQLRLASYIKPIKRLDMNKLVLTLNQWSNIISLDRLMLYAEIRSSFATPIMQELGAIRNFLILEDFPNELLVKIFFSVPPEGLLKLRLVSHRMKEVSDHVIRKRGKKESKLDSYFFLKHVASVGW